MNWFKRNTKRVPLEINVPRVHFLGEQDGAPEQFLKAKLADFFRRDGSVRRAYLARVHYGDERAAGVVLGLRTQFGPDKGMVEKIGAIFASAFGAKEHLDILFLEDDQEAELAKVCKPFFDES